MPPHYSNIVPLHRGIAPPAEFFAEHLQLEEQRLHTTDELIFAAWLGGFVGVLVTVGLAFAWAAYLA